MGRKRSNDKKSKVYLFLIILLAILLVTSRTCHKSPDKEAAKQILENSLNTSSNPATPEQEEETKKQTTMYRPDNNQLMGRIQHTHPDMVPVDPAMANRSGMYLHKEAWEAFLQMHAAAHNDGIRLIIVSAFRTFDHQKRIWENKWNGNQTLTGNINAAGIPNPVERAREILKYSAMPGTSRHHWGTDIDINSLNNNYFLSGKGLKEYEWLRQNAHTFGFCQPYTAKGPLRNQGYEEEKWHWSYMPLASAFLKQYNENISYEHINDFQGWETASQIKVKENYVMAIDDNCLNF